MTWCLLLTGLPNSGKSTLAYNLVQARLRNVLIIDGDKHREMQFLGKKLGFEKTDIMANNDHVIKLARFAQGQGINVIIAQIVPYLDQRKLMREKLDGFYEVRCRSTEEARGRRPNFKHTDIKYENGKTCDLLIDTDILSINESINIILKKWDREGQLSIT